MKSPKKIVRLALVAALAILVAGGIRAARRATEARPLLGVAVGMTADEVRERFDPASPGFFMIGSEGGEPLLVWHPRGRGGDTLGEARFEFEDGHLTEARFSWPPGVSPADAAGELGLPGAVRAWELGAGSASLDVPSGRGPVVSYAASR